MERKEYTSPREKVDFMDVINHALRTVFDARAKIVYVGNDDGLYIQFTRYWSAVQGLCSLVTPIVPATKSLWEEARKTFNEIFAKDGVQIMRPSIKLDEIVSKIVTELAKAGLLFREERTRVGSVGASEVD